MQLTDLLWIFFIVVTLQPILRMKIIDAARLRLIRKLEMKRNSRAIMLIHRQETMALLGFPLSRFIDIQDSEDVLRAIKLTDPDVPIDMVLHTPGGLVLAAEQIALALCRHSAKVTVFVPHYAMSGGTLIALAADEIAMDENAVLGPIDPQIGELPAASLLSVVEQKGADHIDDQTLVLVDVARKALAQMQLTVERILSKHLAPDRAKAMAELLTSGRWTHDYPIGVDEARQLGLSVSAGIPDEVYDLMSLFPQATQRRPSVQFVPMPYPGQRQRKGG
jgi:ClpP class serine protease